MSQWVNESYRLEIASIIASIELASLFSYFYMSVSMFTGYVIERLLRVHRSPVRYAKFYIHYRYFQESPYWYWYWHRYFQHSGFYGTCCCILVIQIWWNIFLLEQINSRWLSILGSNFHFLTSLLLLTTTFMISSSLFYSDLLWLCNTFEYEAWMWMTLNQDLFCN